MKSNLDFHADIDYAHGLRRPHWHLRPSLQTLERSFYPERMTSAAWLEFYVLKFDAVELENSFYRLPTADAFRAS
jgi:uncharacterized protein YecE (DUF72 family)